MVFHRFFGFAIFTTGIFSCCLGFLEKIGFLGLAPFAKPALVGNTAAILILLTGIAVMWEVYARRLLNTNALLN